MMAGRTSPPWKIGEPLALKDALRTVRFMAQRGRRFARDSVPSVVPQPADRLIASALTQADTLASRIEREAARFVYSSIGSSPDLPDLRIADADPGKDLRAAQFAEAAYRGLMKALELLQAESALVSESAARSAYAAVAERSAAHPERWGALLIREMLQRRVVREVSLVPGGHDEERLVAHLALFALMIWLLSDRDAGDALEALEASVALAIGLRDELAAVGDDVGGLAGLLKEFRHHV
jgi:hypothetical protein